MADANVTGARTRPDSSPSCATVYLFLVLPDGKLWQARGPYPVLGIAERLDRCLAALESNGKGGSIRVRMKGRTGGAA